MTFTHIENGRTVVHAMPVMVLVLTILAIAYRYYSAFLAAKVAAFDDSRVTPATLLNDGQNYHPTNRWVLFGHHFAAISGAGPLIGPVFAIQYGYMPGLLWLVVGVCLAGAVQDMLVLAASTQSDGKSIAEIARRELGNSAAVVASVAILFIVVIALAGLGIIVVKALGGEEAMLADGTTLVYPASFEPDSISRQETEKGRIATFPPGYLLEPEKEPRSDALVIRSPEPWTVQRDTKATRVTLAKGTKLVVKALGGEEAMLADGTTLVYPASFEPELIARQETEKGRFATFPPGYLLEPEKEPRSDALVIRAPEPWTIQRDAKATRVTLATGTKQVIPGSSWGTFTIAATIPIALFVGLWMNRLRKGRVVEASLLGGALTIGAVVVGGWVPGSSFESWFTLTRSGTVLALAIYGFIAAVLPVWLLLGPRDYLSSFLKIGTVAMLIGGVLIVNPPLRAPVLNETFLNGGPTVKGAIFPFVFICIMCGAVSGFHALVSSGTTPKMLEKESHARSIGYGAMLIECIVGITALIAAATLPPELYYEMNVEIPSMAEYRPKIDEVLAKYGSDPLHATNVDDVGHLKLGDVERKVGGETLRGRTGGAVTLAVGMSVILEDAFQMLGAKAEGLLKYWYHFAVMFEALFILTTIDAGTRIGRFLLQEALGKVHKPLAAPNHLAGSLIAAGVIVASWSWLIHTGSVGTIWPMFGVANQLLAALSLAIVTTWLVNRRRSRYVFVTLIPLAWVVTTTYTAGTILVTQVFKPNSIPFFLTLFVLTTVGGLLVTCAARWVGVWTGKISPNKS